ncbi:MAG TPA: hypothetical protein VMD28_01125 [Acidimicrobiales bacterium]|nr:hypothetical protein [Acidimicrobiales bacterium]
MAHVTNIGRVPDPVVDQDGAIEFSTKTLGFSKTADTAFGDGARWVEVRPPGGGACVALVPPEGSSLPGERPASP